MILVLPPDVYLQNGSIGMVTQCLSLEYPHSMKMYKIDQRLYLQDVSQLTSELVLKATSVYQETCVLNIDLLAIWV